MADSILSSLRSKASLSIVNKSGTGDSQGQDVAKGLRVTRVSIRYSSRPMRHMLENGSSIVDARIIDQTTISLDVICPTLDELSIVNSMLLDRKSTYRVTSKSISVDETVCEDVGILQNAEMLSASPVRIKMRQLMRQGGNKDIHQVVEQPADSSIFGRGIQTLQQVTAQAQRDVLRTVQDIFSTTIVKATRRG